MDKARDATKQENAATEVESTNAASSPPQALSDSTKNEVAGDDTKAEATAEETNVNSNSTIQLRNRNVKKQKNYFYIGGGNGSYLVEENLTRLGWERIHDKNREDYKLKWCEIKANNNYHLFREGEQLVYQIPNNKLLTTKIGLLTSLQEYDRVMNKVKKGRPRIMRYQDFLPETFRLDIKDERELFFEQYVDGEVWISKPTGLNQGKGIYLIRSTEDIARIQEKMMEDDEEVQTARKLPFKIPMARIVQRYVLNPLLLDGRKFDVRNYLVIACANPLVVLYRDGYCRLTCTKYDVNSTDLTGHLTNQFMQKKNPLYEEVKEDTVWSMERFNDYINENFADEFDLQENWVNTVLKRRCQQIMLHCFQAARHKFECRLGYFDLIGCDFLIHDDFKISLLEMNCNPALHTNCDTLKDVIPDVVGETLGLALECFEKSNRREKMQPFATLHNCTLLYNGDVIEAAERRERMQSAAEARRRQRSAQRRKRFVPGQYVYRRNQNPTTNATAAATTATASAATTSAACVTSQHGSFNTVTSPRGTNVSVATSTTSLQTNGCVTTSSCVTSTSAINLPSSTVVAGTTASQQRVVAHSKSNSSVQVKPFYAGGTVASRPYSSPRFKPTRYAQVEPRIDTHNSLMSLDSPRRNSVNNAALVAATNSRIVSYAQKGRNELYAPKRNNAGQTGGGIKGISEEEMNDLLDDINDELGMISENLLEEIMDDEDEEGCRDEEEDEEGSGGASLRRPSARLPVSYHNMVADISISDLSTASSRVVAQINDLSVRRRVKRIASLAIRQNGVIPTTTAATDLSGGFPIGETVQISPRSSFDAAQQINKNYRAPTTVRLRQSLQATTCTLEIGPKSRRGLIAVTPGKQLLDRGENNKHRRRSQNAKLKLIKQNIFPPDDDHDVAASPPLLYNATSQMQRSMTGEGGAVGPKLQMQIPAPLPLGAAPLPLGPAPLGPAPLPLGSAHNTTTHNLLRRSEAIIPYTHHTRLVSSLVSPGHGTKPDSTVTPRRNLPPTNCSEEQVIWRLRSRATPDRIGAGQKVLLKVPVMAQSPPGLTHSPPRRFVDVVTPRQLVKNDASRKKSDLTTRLRQQVEGEAQADLTVVAQRPVVVLVGADQSVSAKPIRDESDDQRASLTFTAG